MFDLRSNRNSGYVQVSDSEFTFTSKPNSPYFTPEKTTSTFGSSEVVLRQNSGRRFQKTDMSTFGKEKTNSDIENSVKKYLDSVHYDSSPIVIPIPDKQGGKLTLPYV